MTGTSESPFIGKYSVQGIVMRSYETTVGTGLHVLCADIAIGDRTVVVHPDQLLPEGTKLNLSMYLEFKLNYNPVYAGMPRYDGVIRVCDERGRVVADNFVASRNPSY